jgi:hypothetical protein
MIGLFKLYDNTGVTLYELMLLNVRDGTLSLKVKHFNPDFTAWEEKGDLTAPVNWWFPIPVTSYPTGSCRA